MAEAINEIYSYQPLSKDELGQIWNKHKTIMEDFIRKNDYDPSKVFVNDKLIMALIAKVDQRKKYFRFFHKLDMSECKEVALIAFWYIKLQPICASSRDVLEDDLLQLDAINEKMAVYYILSTLKAILIKQNLPLGRLNELPITYIEEMVYSFRYRDFSKESLIFLVETMAIFLGLDPYKQTSRN